MTFNEDELRLIAVSGPLWLRMLSTRADRIIAKMHGEFRNGRTDHLASLAELACVRDQQHEITSALKQLDKGDRNATDRSR